MSPSSYKTYSPQSGEIYFNIKERAIARLQGVGAKLGGSDKQRKGQDRQVEQMS